MHITELINIIVLSTFTLGLVSIAVLILRRLVDYYREGIRPPLLAKRDIGLIGGLAVPFMLIAMARVFDWEVFGQAWWSLLTGVPAVLGVLQFAYIEYFIVERKESRGYLRYLAETMSEKQRQEQKEDKDFGDKRRLLEAEHLRNNEDNGSTQDR